MDNRSLSPDDRTLASYLSDLRSGKPTPGGGSASAYCAAFGASLGAMVCRLTLGRAIPEVTTALSELADTFDDLTERLSQAARDDELCFTRYQAATRLPKGTEEEKRARREARQEALRLAAEAPLLTAELAVRALKALPTVARLGTPHALSDVETARILLMAGLHGALVNVQVNLDLISDAAVVESLWMEMSVRRSAAVEAEREVEAALSARQAQRSA